MRLVLVRHADAGDRDPARYPDDRERPVTPEGEREQRLVAQALDRLGLRPSRVLTSPLRRAVETAQVTARVLGGPAPIDREDALGDRFSVEGLLAALARLPADAVVYCVGHEPDLSQFAARLLHPDGRVRLALPKSGVIVLECDGRPELGGARLLLLLSPSAIRGLST
jgi:phosphohistidine phosphatase